MAAVLCLVVSAAPSLISLAEALNQPTHKIVNREAALVSGVDVILKEQLGIVNGLEEVLFGESALEWLALGGDHEDDGTRFDIVTGRGRFFRHFHDPRTESWETAGLRFGLVQYESSARWMQRTDQSQAAGGNWGWPRARDEFAKALSEREPGTRLRALADTFLALGHVMHLIVDASVPEHTRHDPHPLEGILRDVFGVRGYYGNYEYWVSDQHLAPGSISETAFVDVYLFCPVCPIRPDPTIFADETGDPAAPLRVARLLDTNRYLGTDPNVTLSGPIGIAEFANANFFSEDTVRFRLTRPNYPFPDPNRLVRAEVPTPVPAPAGSVTAYFGKALDDGLQVFPVLAECVFDGFVLIPVRCTEDEVWKQVATEMLPRALGHAAGVLDYFFRGRLDVSVQVFQIFDPVTFQLTDELGATVTVFNGSADEDMVGTFEVYYDTPDGTRQPFGVSPTGTHTLRPGEGLNLNVAQLPPNMALTDWTVVFRGTLGREDGAVVGRRVGISYGVSLVYHRTESTATSLPPVVQLTDRAFCCFGLSPGPGSAFVVGASEFFSRIAAFIFVTSPSDIGTFWEIGFSSTVVTLPPNAVTGGVMTARSSGTSQCVGSSAVQVLPPPDRQILFDVPATLELVEYEPARDLAALRGYSYLRPPPFRRVLRSFSGDIVDPVQVDVRGVQFLGLRLVTHPSDPGPQTVGSGITRREAGEFCRGFLELTVP
jgi:hypothetical protein